MKICGYLNVEAILCVINLYNLTKTWYEEWDMKTLETELG